MIRSSATPSCAPARPLSRRSPGAFTLLELIVVIVMIAILAGAFLPRLSGQARRAAEAESIAVQRLLTAAAERAALVGGHRLAVEFATLDGVSTLAVVSRPPSSPGPGSAGAASRNTPEWKQDLLVDPVTLTRLELKQATLDGRRLDARGWLAPLGSAQARPTIALVLSPKDDPSATAYRIDLFPDAIVAQRTPMAADQLGVAGSRAVQSGPPTRSIDLDATGRGDSPW